MHTFIPWIQHKSQHVMVFFLKTMHEGNKGQKPLALGVSYEK